MSLSKNDTRKSEKTNTLGRVKEALDHSSNATDRTPGDNASQGPGNFTRNFTHDPLRRLISATGRENKTALPQPTWDLNVRPEDWTATNTYTRNYTYDKLGNIKTLAHIANGLPANNFTRTYNYQDSFTHNRLSNFAIGANTYASTFNANGNQTNENTDRHFEWNFSDKLVFFKKQAGAGPPGILKRRSKMYRDA